MNRLAWRLETGPHPDRAADWLGSGRVVLPDGGVWSWVNPDHPGHRYPEAAAWWLSWAVWRAGAGFARPPEALVTAVRRGLVADLAGAGAVGRGGILYLFDTCVAVDALARADARWGPGPGSWTQPAVAGLERFVRAGRPVLGDTRGLDGRWSARFGPHLLKAAALLLRADRSGGGGAFSGLADAILARVAWDADPSRPCYGHALAYAAEGASLLKALGREVAGVSPFATAEWFAAVQRSDGSIPAWMDGSGPARADATAQAVRLWVATDSRRYRVRIEAGLAFLERQRAPEGGIPYEPGSGDLNTWTTVFADQAAAWARGLVDPLDWV